MSWDGRSDMQDSPAPPARPWWWPFSPRSLGWALDHVELIVTVLACIAALALGLLTAPGSVWPVCWGGCS